MIAIKLVLRDEARRAQISSEQNHFSFSLLVTTAQNLFPSLRGKPNIEFYWKDEDDDTIVVSSNEELVEAARVMAHNKRSVMRFEIRENLDGVLLTSFQAPEAPTATATVTACEVNTAVHSNVRCDCCDVIPIVGTRYKCAIREDFDLCESCENRNLQPHPMIKIYSPSQAPAAIFVAVKGDECPRGLWKGSNHRGRPPNGHNDGPCPPPTWQPSCRGPFSHPEDTSPQDLPFGPYPGGVWRRAMRQQARRNNEACEHGQGGWNAAAGAFSKSTSGGLVHPFNGPVSGFSSESAEHPNNISKIEEEFIEEAVRQSLEGSAINAATATNTASPAAEDILLQASPPAAVPPSISQCKPMNRFVKDVTFPDGTSVQPGSIFLKTWRIRNDGANPWPENVVLCCAGGDFFSPPDLMQPIDSLLPGTEADITLQLSAPERSGRHVAYFRMRTSDGVWFGHKLWADIRVAEDDQGWQLLGGMLGTNVVSPSLSRADSQCSFQINMAQPTDLTHDVEAVSRDIPHALQVAHTATCASTNTSAVPEAVNLPETESFPDHESADGSEGNMRDSQASVVAVWTRVWSKELQILVEMGFTDTAECVRLLQQHLGIPSSLTPADSHVSPEGMQNVITALLSE
jgi:Ig-like domain from next to BRCA1 gene/Zinc finger, ZZ type/PB1 domain